jgi:hypothetical protein
MSRVATLFDPKELGLPRALNLREATQAYWRISRSAEGRDAKPVRTGTALRLLSDTTVRFSQRPLGRRASCLLDALIKG